VFGSGWANAGVEPGERLWFAGGGGLCAQGGGSDLYAGYAGDDADAWSAAVRV